MDLMDKQGRDDLNPVESWHEPDYGPPEKKPKLMLKITISTATLRRWIKKLFKRSG